MVEPERGGGVVGVRGVVLAAGAGRRMGRPKVLVADWLERAVVSLAAHGLPVTVVVGAEPGAARDRVSRAVEAVRSSGADLELDVVEAAEWAEGMGASLRAALAALAAGDPAVEACVVTLVDLPDVGAPVVGRLLQVAGRGALARAAYAGTPGHPVLLGRDHWAGVAAGAEGDQGARAYLRTHEVTLVECGDLATGLDVDTPEGLSGPSGS